MLVAAGHILTTGQTYSDPGGDYFAKRDPERTAPRLIAQFEELGHAVTLEPATLTATSGVGYLTGISRKMLEHSRAAS